MRAVTAVSVVVLVSLGLLLVANESVAASKSSTADTREDETPLTAENWPTTVKATVADILKGMPEESVRIVKSTAKDDLIKFHHGWGTGIRNHYGLWRGNKELLRDACGGDACHPDDASMVIIEAVWEELRARGNGG